MLNGIWVAMIVGAILCGALFGQLDAVAEASTQSAGSAVTLAIGLVGVMAFWLGLMQMLQQAGVLRGMALALRPIMSWLFPEVPAGHPAMSMMILNIVANMLGLGNAATPFGLKAMMELNKLNKQQGTATNAMALFLAINTSQLALLPTGIIALRASLDATAAGSIVAPTLLATACSTVVAIVVTKALQGLPVFCVEPTHGGVTGPKAPLGAVAGMDTSEAEALMEVEAPPPSARRSVVVLLMAAAVGAALLYALLQEASVVKEGEPVGWLGALHTAMTQWALVLLILIFVLYGTLRGVKAYDAVVAGGKEGFEVAIRIIPFLVAILVAVGMLRASGAIGLLVTALDPFTSLVGMPAEVLPMALLRPLSGSGAYGVAAEIMKIHGPDSLVGQIVSTMQGSTETTFYVMALYFGAVGVRNSRHTLVACLAADVTGALGAVWACRLLL